jgi:hypothetical protein
MQTFLGTLALFGIAMVAMALGVIFSNRRLRGSCGGVDEDCSCSVAKREACLAKARAAAATTD